MTENKDATIQSLRKEIKKLQSELSKIEISVRDEYLHSQEWVKSALEKLVYFAAIDLQPASLELFHNKIVEFLGNEFFGYNYTGFFAYNDNENKWEMLAEKGIRNIDFESMPEFKGSMVIEEDQEIYYFFDIDKNSYLIHASLVGTEKKFSKHDFSFISLFVVLASSFYTMKFLDREVQEKMIESSNMKNAERVVNRLKESAITLEDAFVELIENLNINTFVIARNFSEHEELKIVLSDGIEVRSWSSFMKTVLESEEHAGEDWLFIPMFDEDLAVYGATSFKLSHNLSIKAIQERVLKYSIRQFVDIISNKQLQKESITDELTGAFNRRYAMKLLKEKFNRAVLNPETGFSVAMIDIDNFKSVNDTYGHLAGDAVLKKVVESFSKALREVDVIGRYGGEEFLILISTRKDVALKVCERVRTSVESAKTAWNGTELWVTVSIGLVSFDSNIKTVEEMVAMADLSLYKAKKLGKNRVVRYSETRGEL